MQIFLCIPQTSAADVELEDKVGHSAQMKCKPYWFSGPTISILLNFLPPVLQ